MIFFYILGYYNLPQDIGSKSEGPSQPKLLTFPSDHTIAKKKTCRFNPEWYKKHPWISYSASANKVFCYACIHFLRKQKEDRFTVKGFNNWAYAVIRIRDWINMENVTTTLLQLKDGKAISQTLSPLKSD
jgi:hypothetical protein